MVVTTKSEFGSRLWHEKVLESLTSVVFNGNHFDCSLHARIRTLVPTYPHNAIRKSEFSSSW